MWKTPLRWISPPLLQQHKPHHRLRSVQHISTYGLWIIVNLCKQTTFVRLKHTLSVSLSLFLFVWPKKLVSVLAFQWWLCITKTNTVIQKSTYQCLHNTVCYATSEKRTSGSCRPNLLLYITLLYIDTVTILCLNHLFFTIYWLNYMELHVTCF